MNIPAALRRKHRHAVAARSGEGSTGLSSSSGEEDKKCKSQEAEIKELRAQVEQLRRQRGEARVKESQSADGFASARCEGLPASLVSIYCSVSGCKW